MGATVVDSIWIPFDHVGTTSSNLKGSQTVNICTRWTVGSQLPISSSTRRLPLQITWRSIDRSFTMICPSAGK